MAIGPLLLESDNDVGVDGISDEQSGTFLNTGALTYSVSSVANPTVVIASGSCAYVAASNGKYLGIIDASVMTTTNFSDGGLYYVKWTFNQGNYDRVWRDETTASYGG